MAPSSALTTLNGALERGDAIRFWRVPRYGGLECLSAVFRRHRYVPHTHETYAIAAVVEGCEAFHHRGERHYAHAGSIAAVPPDELHDGEPAGDGFVYRTLYPSVELMRSIAEDVFGRPCTGTPGFRASVLEDRQLSAGLAHLHGALADSGATLLERDTLLTEFFGVLLARWGGLGEAPVPGREHAPVARAKAYLDERFAGDVPLEDLAAVAGLNRAHLVRAFRREHGTTPHAYQLDRRVRAAGRMLAAGDPPAEVAIACGFCDQSHLNRVFKSRMGVTPGMFRADTDARLSSKTDGGARIG
jgi:AraC-like DNA-binding protein